MTAYFNYCCNILHVFLKLEASMNAVLDVLLNIIFLHSSTTLRWLPYLVLHQKILIFYLSSQKRTLYQILNAAIILTYYTRGSIQHTVVYGFKLISVDGIIFIAMVIITLDHLWDWPFDHRVRIVLIDYHCLQLL